MKINKERLKTFESTCEKYKNKLRFENITESLLHHKPLWKFKVVGCLMQKVGSTSLMETINQVNEVDRLDQSATVGWSKTPVSSQTYKLMAGTKFSDYFGLKHYQRSKKNKNFIHLNLAN